MNNKELYKRLKVLSNMVSVLMETVDYTTLTATDENGVVSSHLDTLNLAKSFVYADNSESSYTDTYELIKFINGGGYMTEIRAKAREYIQNSESANFVKLNRKKFDKIEKILSKYYGQKKKLNTVRQQLKDSESSRDNLREELGKEFSALRELTDLELKYGIVWSGVTVLLTVIFFPSISDGIKKALEEFSSNPNVGSKIMSILKIIGYSSIIVVPLCLAVYHFYMFFRYRNESINGNARTKELDDKLNEENKLIKNLRIAEDNLIKCIYETVHSLNEVE